MFGDSGDVSDSLLEDLLVVGGRLAEPADLPDELQGGGFDFFTGCGCGPLAEDLYGSTHDANGNATEVVSDRRRGDAPVDRTSASFL